MVSCTRKGRGRYWRNRKLKKRKFIGIQVCVEGLTEDIMLKPQAENEVLFWVASLFIDQPQ